MHEGFYLGPLEWSIAPRQKWLIAGRNGAGKSALVSALQGEGKLMAGAIAFDPTLAAVVSADLQETLIEQERLQSDGEDERLVGTPVIDILNGLSPDQERLADFIDAFDLAACLRQPFRTLSTGETRKVLLVRALASSRPLLILDDPAKGLDASSSSRLQAVLETATRDRTVLYVTNDIDNAPQWINHLVLVEAGRLTYCGPSRDLELKPWLNQMMTLADETLPLPERYPNALPELAPDAPLVDMRQVQVAFGDRVIFSGLDWRIQPGEHWQITGANGSGKTTLLNLITGDSPHCYTNDLTVFGFQRGSGESIWQIKQYIGLVSSGLHLAYRVSSSLENVVISGFFDSIGVYQKASDGQIQIARGWLRRIGLDAARRQPFNQLSYGNQRLVLIARAMVKQPSLLILDEPCLGLDAPNRSLVLSLVRQLIKNRHTTVLYVSHDVQDRLAEIPHTLSLSE